MLHTANKHLHYGDLAYQLPTTTQRPSGAGQSRNQISCPQNASVRPPRNSHSQHPWKQNIHTRTRPAMLSRIVKRRLAAAIARTEQAAARRTCLRSNNGGAQQRRWITPAPKQGDGPLMTRRADRELPGKKETVRKGGNCSGQIMQKDVS